MSNSLNTTSTNSTDPTIDDPRVQDIAAVSGRTPEDVLAFAKNEAQETGDTVSDELDTGEEVAEMVKDMLGSTNA